MGQSGKYYDEAVSRVRVSAAPSATVWRGICATPSATLCVYVVVFVEQTGRGGWWRTLHARMRTPLLHRCTPLLRLCYASATPLPRLCYIGVAGRACYAYATGVARGVAENGTRETDVMISLFGLFGLAHSSHATCLRGQAPSGSGPAPAPASSGAPSRAASPSPLGQAGLSYVICYVVSCIIG